MTWNHRVVRHKDGRLAIHEVYYDQHGAPDMVTEEPAECMAEDNDLTALRREIARFTVATMRPILDMSQFEAGEKIRGEA